jgi:hypothetical protein
VYSTKDKDKDRLHIILLDFFTSRQGYGSGMPITAHRYVASPKEAWDVPLSLWMKSRGRIE